MAYNPYSDIKSIYDLKGQWDEANNSGDKVKANKIAATAQAYYDKLKNNNYGGVAKALSASGYKEAKSILDSYAPKTTTSTSTTTKATTAPDSTSLSNNELITTNNNETRNKVNQLWGNQTSDRKMMTSKYSNLEDVAYSNPFDTEEAKAILAKYDLSAMQGRDNVVASGGASNGGNIDSYAAANALRQQSAIINQGHQVVLDAHNNKINNVKGILESLGVYQQNQDKGMQNTIGIQQEEGQRLFENDETAKNNEVARLSEQASVTGYVPSEWVIKNDDVYNTYLNADGTFKKEMESVDIQALIDSAKASGDTETAQKLAVVRARKILSNYGQFGKYANEGDISYMKPQITEARRESEQNDATVRETLKSEKEINDANNQNKIDQIKANTEGQKDILTHTADLQGNGGVTALSDDANKVAKLIMNKVNDWAKVNHSVSVIDDLGRNTYKLNLPKGHDPDWWDDIVFQYIDESTLTEEEAAIFIEQLGLSAYWNDWLKKTGKLPS